MERAAVFAKDDALPGTKPSVRVVGRKSVCRTLGQKGDVRVCVRALGPRHLRQSRLLRYVKAPQPVSSWQFQYGRFQRVSES